MWKKYLSRLWIISEINEVTLNVIVSLAPDVSGKKGNYRDTPPWTWLPRNRAADRCLIVKAFERGRQKTVVIIHPGRFRVYIENLRQARNLRISRVASLKHDQFPPSVTYVCVSKNASSVFSFFPLACQCV